MRNIQSSWKLRFIKVKVQSSMKRIKKKGKKSDLEQKLKKNDNKNFKAFNVYSTVKAGKAIRRTLDLATKKHNLPLPDRSGTNAPPYIVAVVGPPKVGKTTLINSLIKHYTKQKINNAVGPITVVSGKNKRLSFLECNNDLNSMIDISKIADLVLMLVDASYGFEMETFEFLNMLQVHGFCKVIGVLTHLDVFKKTKNLTKTKKRLKDRFWTEIYQGAKLFYLSGLIGNRYHPREILNLTKFIAVMKFRPLIWKSAHPFVLVDRFEDLSNPEEVKKNPKGNRTVALYGYCRGTNLKQSIKVHIPGCGDLYIKELSYLADPCPLPDAQKKRKLLERETLIYAPMSDIGDALYDNDAVYIEMGNNVRTISLENKNDDIEVGEGCALVNSLINTQTPINMNRDKSEIKLFTTSESLKANVSIFENEDNESAERNEEIDETNMIHNKRHEANNFYEKVEVESNGRIRRKVVFEDEKDNEYNDSDEERITKHNEKNSIEWKKNIIDYSKESFKERKNKNIMKLVYGTDEPIQVEEDKSTNEELFRLKEINDYIEQFDSEKLNDVEIDWKVDENKELIKNKFVTGDWEEEDAETILKKDDEEKEDDSKKDFSCFGSDFNKVEEKQQKTNSENYTQKKKNKKEEFNDYYDIKDDKLFQKMKEDISKQTEINNSAFEGETVDQKIQYEGFKPGYYVRVVFNDIPSEFCQNFNPTCPVLIGGLLSNEENLGFVHVRIKKHRWYDRILKNNDPLIISMGWRRFQTIMQYSIQDHNKRHRLLKYTPKHMHCHATFWSPIVPPNTGLLAVQTLNPSSGFRIAATGVVLEQDSSFRIMKKLKIVGVPHQIFTKTAFIKDMFTSELEVSKFIGASIKTVSGIRGTIKKALSKPSGAFRATFEDKIVPSDIVFLRTWYPVNPTKFYNPVLSLLQKDTWQGMKTVGQLNYERKRKPKSNPDSSYKEIERTTPQFKKLIISKSLQANLPFKNKLKIFPEKEKTLEKEVSSKNKVYQVLNKEEKNVYSLFQQLNILKANKTSILEKKKIEENKIRKKIKEKENLEQEKRKRLRKKEINRTRSKMMRKSNKSSKNV